MLKRSTNSLAAGLFLVACMGAAMAACGQKGPLTLPKTTAAAASPAASASASTAVVPAAAGPR